MKIIAFPNNGALPDKPDDLLRLCRFGETKDEAMTEAARVVPSGVPFIIIDEADVPEDRTYREAWTADFTSPDGYGGQTP